MLWGCSEQRTVRDGCVNTEVGLRSARVSIGNTPVLIPHLGTELRFTVGLRLGPMITCESQKEKRNVTRRISRREM